MNRSTTALAGAMTAGALLLSPVAVTVGPMGTAYAELPDGGDPGGPGTGTPPGGGPGGPGTGTPPGGGPGGTPGGGLPNDGGAGGPGGGTPPKFHTHTIKVPDLKFNKTTKRWTVTYKTVTIYKHPVLKRR
ncbi:hypothetical protein [Mycolicibacterium baixiangningiae]|uniref:hypothetical protein n=1 Tax=Mycolicibacterium baixiangningiae TaxID=2761578 RepID=UPI0018D07E6E|nr:hypothetical protein [Mycolicibacterium baixiangningiae]